MSKSLRGPARAAAPLFDPANERMKSSARSVSPRRGNGKSHSAKRLATQKRHTETTFLPGIIDGERVVVAKPGKVESESSLKTRIRVALATTGVLVWNNPVGGAKLKGFWVPFGLCKGSADLIGLVPPYGRFLGVEVKRAKHAKEADDQKRWIQLVRRWGGVAGFARSVDEALALAKEARRLPTLSIPLDGGGRP